MLPGGDTGKLDRGVYQVKVLHINLRYYTTVQGRNVCCTWYSSGFCFLYSSQETPPSASNTVTSGSAPAPPRRALLVLPLVLRRLAAGEIAPPAPAPKEGEHADFNLPPVLPTSRRGGKAEGNRNAPPGTDNVVTQAASAQIIFIVKARTGERAGEESERGVATSLFVFSPRWVCVKFVNIRRIADCRIWVSGVPVRELLRFFGDPHPPSPLENIRNPQRDFHISPLFCFRMLFFHFSFFMLFFQFRFVFSFPVLVPG